LYVSNLLFFYQQIKKVYHTRVFLFLRKALSALRLFCWYIWIKWFFY